VKRIVWILSIAHWLSFHIVWLVITKTSNLYGMRQQPFSLTNKRIEPSYWLDY